MDDKYSWVNTHKEIVQYLSDKENSQQELIDLLKSVGIGPFNDKSEEGEHDIELSEIDPFTFFCYIHKYGPKRALGFLEQIAELLDLEKPTTVNGIPSAQPQRVWLFPPQYLRMNNEVPRLWNLFYKELNGEVDDVVFADALDIKNVGRAKLTEALFYINPDKYLPINGPTKPYIKKVLGLDYQFSTYTEYMELLKKIGEKTDMPFYELSHEAWVWNKETKETKVEESASEYNAIQSMIEDYKRHIAETHLKDEKYKWELIDEFKGRPNLEVADLHQEIKSIDYSNLMYHLSKAVINELSEEHPKEIRKLFTELFDESIGLTKRVKDFSKNTKLLYKGMGKTDSHHQDERAISTYLTFRYPEKYTFYKHTFYNNYCNLLGIKQAKKNEKYIHYLTLIDKLIEEYIEPDSELIEQVKGYIPDYYDGNDHKLLVQDILYQMLDKNAGTSYWVFQGSPKHFDFEAAMKQDAVESWTVTAHKAKIKVGDKVILWQTGNMAGCYALAEVTSKPYERQTAERDDKFWKEESKNNMVVDIDITHNLMDNPLLKDDINKIEKLANLKVGNQGTNFLSTKDEYEAILELIKDYKGKKFNEMNFPLNTIFYGPPGTGKTYNTVLRAAEIIEDRKIDSYDEALKIFKAKLHNQIEFITFHQNYSYEDFIQGLRPDTSDGTEELLFKKIDGVFKKISDRALSNLRESKKAPAELSKEKSFEEALGLFVDKLNENEGVFKITENCQVYEVEEDAFRYTGDNWTRHAKGLRMKFSDLIEFYKNGVSSRKDIKLLTSISALAKQHATYYYGVYDEILKFMSEVKAPINNVDRQNYVIIIDEINRANISRVFGELITLIEPDKRSGGEIPMEVKLPSGDKFMVPSNLYIVGTMNTADKSIALLDIALRRRFEFEAMYPLYEIEGKEIHDVDILEKLNKKIIETKGYDFQIGHSFFMNSEEDTYNLLKRMNNKVIPLLLEYYMNDDKEVRSILQFALLKIDENSWPLKITGRE